MSQPSRPVLRLFFDHDQPLPYSAIRFGQASLFDMRIVTEEPGKQLEIPSCTFTASRAYAPFTGPRPLAQGPRAENFEAQPPEACLGPSATGC